MWRHKISKVGWNIIRSDITNCAFLHGPWCSGWCANTCAFFAASSIYDTLRNCEQAFKQVCEHGGAYVYYSCVSPIKKYPPCRCPSLPSLTLSVARRGLAWDSRPGTRRLPIRAGQCDVWHFDWRRACASEPGCRISDFILQIANVTVLFRILSVASLDLRVSNATIIFHYLSWDFAVTLQRLDLKSLMLPKPTSLINPKPWNQP